MPIDHTCSCGRKLRLKDELAGKKFRCPACSAVNQAAAPTPASDWLSEELLSQPVPKPSNLASPAQPLPAALQSVTARRPRKKWSFNFDSWLTLAIGVALLLATPVAAVFAYSTYSKARASASWPSADGTITHSTLETKRRKARVYHEPNIEYRYTVNGQEYTGKRRSFVLKEFDMSDSAAQEIVDKYPLNSTHKVFYDPADPSSCTLQTGTSSTGSLLILAIPVVLLAVGAHRVWSALKAAKS